LEILERTGERWEVKGGDGNEEASDEPLIGVREEWSIGVSK
jgi:hypothetical protein